MPMNKLIALALVAVTGAAMLLPTSASQAAERAPGYKPDAAHGGDLAKRWCAACHLVAADQTRAVADVPPFATIAQVDADWRQIQQGAGAQRSRAGISIGRGCRKEYQIVTENRVPALRYQGLTRARSFDSPGNAPRGSC